MQTIEQFPPASQPALLRGVGVALYQSTEEDPPNRARIEALGSPLTQVYEMCQWTAKTTPDGSDWYWQCYELGRQPAA